LLLFLLLLLLVDCCFWMMRQGAALFIWELAVAVNQVRESAGIMIMIKWPANKKLKTKGFAYFENVYF